MSAICLDKTTGLILKNNTFVGTSVLFPWKGQLVSITAGHNLYGRKFDKEPDLEEWSVTDHQGIIHPVTALHGDREFASKHDIILLKLKCQSTLDQFFCPKFCTIPQNPHHTLLFRGKYETAEHIVTQRNIVFNSLFSGSDHKFFCAMDRALLMNDTYKSGNDWLGGWSGSGLFIDHHPELICVGIMGEIPNKGNDGQLLFSSISAINLLGIDLELMSSGDLDFDKVLNKASLNAIFDAIDEQAITEWEINTLYKPQLEFINDKLPKVYPESKLTTNKRRIIKQLLVGKTYLITELKKNEQLFSQYNNAYNIYNLEDKQVYVNNRPEALAALSKIKEDYEKYLEKSIGKDFSVNDVKLLAFYGVSEWIADCSLSFLADE